MCKEFVDEPIKAPEGCHIAIDLRGPFRVATLLDPEGVQVGREAIGHTADLAKAALQEQFSNAI